MEWRLDVFVLRENHIMGWHRCQTSPIYQGFDILFLTFFLNKPGVLLCPCSLYKHWQLLLKTMYRHTVVRLLMQSWHSTTGSCFPTAVWCVCWCGWFPLTDWLTSQLWKWLPGRRPNKHIQTVAYLGRGRDIFFNAFQLWSAVLVLEASVCECVSLEN